MIKYIGIVLNKSFFVLALCLSFFITSCHNSRSIADNSYDNSNNNSSNNNTNSNSNSANSVRPEIIINYAEKLKTTPDKLYNEKLYQFIDEWIGVKYKWGGMDKNGVDCSGFANVVYKSVYDYQLKRSAYDIVKDCDEIKKDDLMEGDFVFFDISSKNSHIGIYLSNNKFVHASTSKGVIISDLNDAYWLKYWGRAGRIK